MAVVFGFLTLLSLAATVTLPRVPAILLASITTAVISWGYFLLIERFVPAAARSLPVYLAVVGVLAFLVTWPRIATDTYVAYEAFGPWLNTSVGILRNMLGALIFLAVFGLTGRKMQLQVDQTKQALDLVRSQAEQILAADESTRQQVAELVHDRVQAGLVTSCLQLQQIRSRLDPDHHDSLTGVIGQLEQIRALDLRQAINTLTPNLRDVDFSFAMDELVRMYQPAMTATIDISLNAPLHRDIRLGTYRIVEQALLNSVRHGQATHCDINIRETGRLLSIEVSDNGRGLPEKPTPGLGTTLITTWCRTLNGSWHLAPRKQGGTTLSATLPLKPPGPN